MFTLCRLVDQDKFGAKALSAVIHRAAKAARELRFIENYFQHHNITDGAGTVSQKGKTKPNACLLFERETGTGTK